MAENLSVLFSEMTPEAEWEGEFNAWYDEEHIPIRMKAPGFAGAQRYKRDERNYLAVYDLTSPEALLTPEYQEIKGNPSAVTKRMLGSVSGFTRYIGRSIAMHGALAPALAAPILYAVFFDVPADRVSEFDAWYDEDHAPALMECPEWLACRRFDLIDSHPDRFNRLALHYLKDMSALESEARKVARASEWRARLAEETWFKGTYNLFEQRGTRFVGQS